MGPSEERDKGNGRLAGKKTVYPRVKRILDLVLALFLLWLLALPMLLIACAVVMESRGGALFRQARIGKDGKTFICLKFRTMYQTAPHSCPAAELRNGERYVTRVGRFLRRASLDELPQLWNVIWGDMSLVGPRPLIPEEKKTHDLRRQCGVYDCRPGISGLAQVSGRNELSDEEKVAYDRAYAENLSLRLDVRIVLRTLGRVITGAGVRVSAEKATAKDGSEAKRP